MEIDGDGLNASGDRLRRRSTVDIGGGGWRRRSKVGRRWPEKTAGEDGQVTAFSQCEDETNHPCNNKSKALSLKIIGIAAILLTSIIGVSLPLITRSIPSLSPDRSLLVVVKAFASGIILATGFMHVLPDSFDMLRSSCLADNPWHKFPFTGFVAMLSAIFTLMVDSMATSMYKMKNDTKSAAGDHEMAMANGGVHFHGNHHHAQKGPIGSQLLRYRVVAMVLELGIVVHSIVIGLGVGASNDVCTIKPLVAALCFHQMFEGMGLGGCILQAEYKMIKKAVMVFFFSVTTPFGIALGIALSKTYKENSPSALITVGLLNASSAGLLIYMALVDLLAADFMGPKLQGSIRLQVKSYAAVLLGAGGMVKFKCELIFHYERNQAKSELAKFLTSSNMSLALKARNEPSSSLSIINLNRSSSIIGIAAILVTSIIGVCLPLVTRSIPALSPDRSLFVVVKAFASGIILATGFMHVLPDSFDMLRSSCLADNPWHKFPFTGFVAMLSAIFTLMVDSMATSSYTTKNNAISAEGCEVVTGDHEMAMTRGGVHFHGHQHHAQKGPIGSQLLRYRVVAMVLELGIVVHSIVIGLGVGASNDVCTIKPLVAALCFHQMFEGMGLGGCILQAEYKTTKKAVMVFFFSITTPFGIALGIALSKTYKENSPSALITVGLLNASSAGLLIYMALVDLLAADFMGPKLQGSIKLQIKSYVAVLLGAGGMSLMAKWA
ncbi:hypothetical protein OSB04_021784 [Centaurea solstitialis]|uniref:Uncharacterized protein n=1 Tax=Centaurea solstitialis TaxID=347529 RepID=A0AA38T888_9ASTR|nr:hypothetical protein OSB04_021784 [Centaurea solstitialis]